MWAPRVFVSMTGVLIVFAVSAYLITDSLYSAFIQTLICAVLLQVGYFIGILYLVRRERKLREERIPSEAASARNPKDNNRRDGLRADAAPNLPAGDT